MGKLLKVLLWIAGGIVGLVVVALAAVAMFFDPNDYKDQIVKAVKDETGRELTIKGDLELHVFPWLAVGIGEMQLGNAEGFGPQPMLEFKEIAAGLRLLPLIFTQSVELRTIKVDGLTVRLAVNAEGKNNWDDLSKPKEEKPEAPKSEGGGFSLTSLNVGGVAITNANLAYDDAKAGTAYKVENLRLETGALALGEPMPLDFSCLLTSTKPDVAADVKLAAQITADLAGKVYSIDDLVLGISARGAPIPAGKQDVTLAGDVRFDQGQGAVSLKDIVFTVAGLTLKAAIEGQGLNGDTPALTGRLSTDPFSPRKLAGNLGVDLPATTDPTVLSDASLSANYAGTFKNAKLSDMAIKLDQTTLSGFVDISDFATQAVKFGLKVDSFDADRYLPPASTTATTEAPAKKKGGDINAIELPVAALDALNVAGDFEMGLLKVKNLKLTDTKLALNFPKGSNKTTNLSANFYEGSIKHSLKIVPGAKPGYAMNADVAGINSQPLVKDFMAKDLMEGKGNFSMAVTSSGKTVGNVRRNLNGNLKLNFDNGALKGFNLEQTIESSKAKFRGEAYTPPAEEPKTEFGELKLSAVIVNGVMKTNDLNAVSKKFKVTGEGQVDLYTEQFDLTAKPIVTDPGNSKTLQELVGLVIPIRVYGNVAAPQYSIDWSGALKARAKQEVDKQVERGKEKLQEKLGEKLGDFFKKK